MVIVGLILLATAIAVVVMLWATRRRGIVEEWCPHGYDDFGCQPSCPLYRDCWGEDQ